MKTLFSFLAFLIFANFAFAQQTQTIRGRVIDETSKTPLIGVTVLVTSSDSSKLLGVATDLNGEFKIQNVPIGRQTVKFSFIGYEEQVMNNLVVTAGKEVVLEIVLVESLTALNEIVVEYDRSQDKSVTNNELSTVSARSFNTEDTKRYAGALGDPSRMAANFAGVISGNDSRNDIVVRGNSPTGMLWQLEGINIPNPNHFGAIGTTGGPVSILNNNVLGKSDFLTSAFPSQYGNGLSGVFDLKMRNGNNEKSEYVGQIGFNGFEVGAEAPISKQNKSSFIVNYRYSTLGLMQDIGINFGTGSATPNYQDLNFKLNFPTQKGRFTVFGVGGMSDVKFLGNDADTTQGNLYANENENSIVDFRTGVIGTSYEHRISDKTFAKITLGASGTEQNFVGDSISVETRQAFRNGEAKFTTQKYSALLSLNHKFNARHSLYVGGNIDLFAFNLFNKNIYGGGTSEQILVDINDNTLLSQGYATWKYRINQKLTMNAGLHFQHYSLNKQAVAEPRLGLKYLIDATQSISIGYGLHSQIQNIYSSYVITPTSNGIAYTNKDLGFTRSHHFVMTYERTLGENLLLKSEVYYQSLFDVPVEQLKSSFSTLNTGASFNPLDEDSLVNKGTGYNYGIEITLERYFAKNYYFLITTSLFDSKYKGSDGIERNTAFNSNYVLNILAGKEWKIGKSKNNVLALNFKLSTVGGRYFTPLNFDASKLEGEAVYDNTRAFSERQSAYFRNDIKIAYRKEYKKSTLEIALDLQNITNHQNIFQQTYNRRTNQIVNQYQQAFFPVPFIRYTF